MKPSDHLTVVVPTRDRPERLEACLDALDLLDVRPLEIIVVDSASSDRAATAPALRRGLVVVRCDLPGASRARNAGWEVAAGQIVAFVDDDVRVRSDWASSICQPFGVDDVVLVTGGVVAGEPVGAEVGDRPPVAVTDDVVAGPFDRSSLGNVGASANLVVRRSALESVGGFDVLLGAGARFRAAEDLDLFDRLLDVGRGWHVPEAVGFHDPWRDRWAVLRLQVAYGTGYGVRLSKVLRTDRRRGMALVRYETMRLGRDVRHDVRIGYELGVVTRLGWSVAAVVGLVRGMVTPIQGGHLVPRP